MTTEKQIKRLKARYEQHQQQLNVARKKEIELMASLDTQKEIIKLRILELEAFQDFYMRHL